MVEEEVVAVPFPARDPTEEEMEEDPERCREDLDSLGREGPSLGCQTIEKEEGEEGQLSEPLLGRVSSIPNVPLFSLALLPSNPTDPTIKPKSFLS